MSELVERLRNADTYRVFRETPYCDTLKNNMREAADRIEALESENARLKTDLKICRDLSGVSRTVLVDENARLREAAKKADQLITDMGAYAYKVGLEGTSDWDRVAGAAGMYAVQDELRAALNQQGKTGDDG